MVADDSLWKGQITIDNLLLGIIALTLHDLHLHTKLASPLLPLISLFSF